MAILSKHSEPVARGGTASAGAVAAWLALAAAPIFVAMACVTAFAGEPQMICSADPGAFPLTGMATMYLLMSIFHLAPWLRLLSHQAPRR